MKFVSRSRLVSTARPIRLSPSSSDKIARLTHQRRGGVRKQPDVRSQPKHPEPDCEPLLNAFIVLAGDPGEHTCRLAGPDNSTHDFLFVLVLLFGDPRSVTRRGHGPNQDGIRAPPRWRSRRRRLPLPLSPPSPRKEPPRLLPRDRLSNARLREQANCENPLVGTDRHSLPAAASVAEFTMGTMTPAAPASSIRIIRCGSFQLTRTNAGTRRASSASSCWHASAKLISPCWRSTHTQSKPAEARSSADREADSMHQPPSVASSRRHASLIRARRLKRSGLCDEESPLIIRTPTRATAGSTLDAGRPHH